MSEFTARERAEIHSALDGIIKRYQPYDQPRCICGDPSYCRHIVPPPGAYQQRDLNTDPDLAWKRRGEHGGDRCGP